MIAFPAGVKVWIAGGVTDMRCGMNSLALRVQEGLGRDPHAGELFCFRGRKGDLVKDLCATADFRRFCVEWPCLMARWLGSGQTGAWVEIYAIAGVCEVRVILFAALSRFCPMAAIASWAWVLARPK